MAACPVALAQALRDPRLRVEPFVQGLVQPTTFCFIGPRGLLVCQKGDGTVHWIKDGVDRGKALDVDVCNAVDAGLVGIAADPNFATNHHVFVVYSASSTGGDTPYPGQWSDHRLERYRWNGRALCNGSGPLFAIPADPTQLAGLGHSQGPIRFGPDGLIYGQIGDHGRGLIGSGKQRVEQNTAPSGSALAGAIWRVAPDGSIPADNPFLGEPDASFHPWFSYGLRNGFGLAFDPLTGALWDTENGPDVYDEVDLVVKGMDSGWLEIMGPDSRDARYVENGLGTFDATDLVLLKNAVYADPVLSFRDPIGITALCFLRSDLFPEELRDVLLFGDTNFGALYGARPTADRRGLRLTGGLADRVADSATERLALEFGSGFPITTDLEVGPDGYLYAVLFGAGAIVRIRPVTDLVEVGSLAPSAGIAASGALGDLGASDDRRYELVRPSGSAAPIRATAAFTLQAEDPRRVELAIEARADGAGALQAIALLDPTSGGWVQLELATIGTTDTARRVAIPWPSRFIDATTRTIAVRVSWSPLPAGSGAPPAPPVTIGLDQLRLEIAYP